MKYVNLDLIIPVCVKKIRDLHYKSLRSVHTFCKFAFFAVEFCGYKCFVSVISESKSKSLYLQLFLSGDFIFKCLT